MADALPAINPGGRDTDPIVKDDAHNASIMSDNTQDFNTTFQTQDFTAKPLESTSKVCFPTFLFDTLLIQSTDIRGG
jgi:hypothetical protein